MEEGASSSTVWLVWLVASSSSDESASAAETGHALVVKDGAEAEWLAGWVALRFLNEPKVALQHFQRMYARVNYPISLSRGAYWIARSYDDLKQPQRAAEWYARAASSPTTYYGQLSMVRANADAVLRLPPDPAPEPELADQFRNHELTRAFRVLAAAGADTLLRSVLDTLLDRADEHPGWRVMTADLAAQVERRDLAVRVAKQSLRDGRMMPTHGYPRIDLPRLPSDWNLQPVEAALVLGAFMIHGLTPGPFLMEQQGPPLSRESTALLSASVDAALS